MKKTLFMFCCLLPVLALSTVEADDIDDSANDGQTVVESDYIQHPENFLHINKHCKLCAVGRRAKAGCVVAKDGKVLLVRDYNSKKWGLPGGTKNKDEIAAMTAFRETLDETGLVVYIDDFISEMRNGFRLFKCKIIKDTGKITGDTLEFKYFTKNDLFELLQKPNRKDLRFTGDVELIYNKFEWIVR